MHRILTLMNVSIENREVIKSFMLAGLMIVSLVAGIALIFIGISRLWGAVLIVLGVVTLIVFLRTYFLKEEFWNSVMAFLLMLIGLIIGGAIAGLFVLVALFFPVI
jgi:hypothetical protein